MGRSNLAFSWIENKCSVLLDCGCSTGEYTNLFSKKSRNSYGIDPNIDFIRLAKIKNPKISFNVANLENLPFQESIFDVVTALEVIEHVDDDKLAIKEMCRVLKKEGILVLTTPNKGLFSFLDSDNYVYLLNKYFPILYKLFYWVKSGVWLSSINRNPGYENKHRHYSLDDLKTLLGNKFEIERSFRSSLLISPLCANIHLLISTIFGDALYSKYFAKFVNFFAEKDYNISFGRFSYYVAIKARKIKYIK